MYIWSVNGFHLANTISDIVVYICELLLLMRPIIFEIHISLLTVRLTKIHIPTLIYKNLVIYIIFHEK